MPCTVWCSTVSHAATALLHGELQKLLVGTCIILGMHMAGALLTCGIAARLYEATSFQCKHKISRLCTPCCILLTDPYFLQLQPFASPLATICLTAF